jgi:hypothetical protein
MGRFAGERLVHKTSQHAMGWHAGAAALACQARPRLSTGRARVSHQAM